MTIFESAIAHSLKKTLNKIIDDETDGVQADADVHDWCDEPTMEDAYEDDLEMSGPGLAQEKTEGAAMAAGTIQEGYITRYWARTWALKLIITEEAMEDGKYPYAIRLAARNKRALWKTVDIDATNMMVRAWDTNYAFGDGKPMFSTTHTIPTGGTFSNTLATPLAPSRAALIIVTSALMKMPGHDGITEGYMPKKILCPVDQWAAWRGILGSEFAPEAGNFNEINVANRDLGMSGKDAVVRLRHWQNTTTNWAVKTDADDGPNLRWRRRPRSRTWVDNNHETMSYGISARWARGLSNPRSVYGSQA